MMNALCNYSYEKNGKEEIKEKLNRSASNERRRCPGRMRCSHKTGVLNLGKAKKINLPKKVPKKYFFILNLEEKK